VTRHGLGVFCFASSVWICALADMNYGFVPVISGFVGGVLFSACVVLKETAQQSAKSGEPGEP